MTRRLSPLSWLFALAFTAFVALVAPGVPRALAAGPPVGLNVRDVANPALQPFQHAALAIIEPGFAGGAATFTVPIGKRLVIEYVSFNIPLANGQAVLGVSVEIVNSIANQIPIGHEIPVLYTVTDLTFLRSIGGSSTRLYADPGSTVRIRVARTGSTGQDLAPVSVSGYFVNLP